MDAPINGAQLRSTLFRDATTFGLTNPGNNADNSWDKRASKLGNTELPPDKQTLLTKSLRTSTSPTASNDSWISLCKGALDNVCKSDDDEEDDDSDEEEEEENGVFSVKRSSGILVRSFPKGVVKSIEVPSGSS